MGDSHLSITLRQIRYFIAAAEAGTMSAAAAQCSVSQSAVTIALRDLEAQLGCPLLHRFHNGIGLTVEGSQFLTKARDILSAVADASRIGGADAEAVGTLTIGVTYTVMGYFIGPLVLRFRRRFPGVSVRLIQMERLDLEAALASDEIDLAVMLVSNVTNPRGISTQILQVSPRRLWLPPGHALLRERSVRLADIAACPYIMLTVDEAESTARRYWPQSGAEPNVVLSTSSIEAVRSFVAGGFGVTILSDMVYRPWSLEGDRIETRTIEDPVPSMDIGFAWRSIRPWSAAVREFVHLLNVATSRMGVE